MRGADEAELELPLDAARARARAAGEEERVVAALEQHARVRLQHVLVEGVPEPPIDAVRAEVVHEEGEDRVREEVLAGAVGGGRQAGALERVAEHDRVHVREVRRHVDRRPVLHEPRELLERALDDHLVVERVEARAAPWGGGPACAELARREQRRRFFFFLSLLDSYVLLSPSWGSHATDRPASLAPWRNSLLSHGYL